MDDDDALAVSRVCENGLKGGFAEQNAYKGKQCKWYLVFVFFIILVLPLATGLIIKHTKIIETRA